MIEKPIVADALAALSPNSQFVVDNGHVLWYSPDIPQPTQAEIDAELARLQAEYDSQAYARNRKAEYPEIGDQLDMLWHAIDTGDWTAAKVKTTEFYTALKAVKDANPK